MDPGFKNEGEYLTFSNKIRDQSNEITKLETIIDAFKNTISELEEINNSNEEKINNYKDTLAHLCSCMSLILNDLN